MDIINFHGKRNEFHDLLVRIEGEKIFPYKLSILGDGYDIIKLIKPSYPQTGYLGFIL
jgi:hypothetical protein